MRKTSEQGGQVVEFSHLSSDHKAEFLQFLLKNNICFQEGKENCVAKVTVKQSNQTQINPGKKKKPLKQKLINGQNNIQKSKLLNTEKPKIYSQPRRQILIKDCHGTPVKKNQAEQLFSSSLSSKSKRDNTIKKRGDKTPKNNRDSKSHSHKKAENPFKKSQKGNQSQRQAFFRKEKKKQQVDDLKENSQLNISISKGVTRKSCEKSRNKTIDKYTGLFQWSLGSQRPVRMPSAMLQKIGEQIYDEIFAKNTHYLQSKNLGNALKSLTQNKFCFLVDEYFRKKFKSTKQVATNLSNFLYSLAYYCEKEACSQFLAGFERFLLNKFDYEDLLFYLFARSIVKRQIKCHEKGQTKSIQFQLSHQVLRTKEINRLLRCIVGKQSDLLQEYKGMVYSNLQNDEINVYGLLRILMQDYRLKRLSSLQGFHDTKSDNFGNTYGSKQCDFERKNTDQLTFGDEYQQDSVSDYSSRQEPLNNQKSKSYYPNFWQCQQYADTNDILYELISEKLQKKGRQLLSILVADEQLQAGRAMRKLEKDLLQKSKSLVKSIFEMNKIKWFRELAIEDPNEKDMEKVEIMQIKLKQLKKSASVKKIGEFCKSVLTVKELINQLETSLSHEINA